MPAVAGDLHLIARVFALLATVFVAVGHHALASRMRTFLGFVLGHCRFLSLKL
jgi:hypothetical protein